MNKVILIFLDLHISLVLIAVNSEVIAQNKKVSIKKSKSCDVHHMQGKVASKEKKNN